MPTVTVSADADAHTDASMPGNNFGSNVSMSVRDPAFQEARGFIRFPVGSYPNVSSLSIYLWATGDTPSMNVYLASTTWSEGSITWSNQPGNGSSIGSIGSSAGGDQWVSGGLSTGALGSLSGVGVVLVWSGGTTMGSFRTKEHSNTAYVSITYNNAPTQPGAFTVPVTGFAYPFGPAIATDWGDSTDADGGTPTYNLYYRLNGGGQVLIASGINGSSYSWTPPAAGSYVLDVYAFDGTTLSSVRQSGTFSVGGAKKRMIVG
jgi:hypothetical protein